VSTPLAFLGFSLVVVLLYHASRSAGWRQGVLFAASIGFLATFFQGFLWYVPFVVFVLGGYAGLSLIRIAPRFSFLPVLLSTLAGFVWLKQYAFVPPRLFLPFAYFTVGLSYILFRILHLLVDQRGAAAGEKVGFFPYLNYILNFTTLTVGPIQLYPDYLKMNEAAAGAQLNFERAAAGLERITRGLFKTNILALLFSTLQSRYIDALTAPQPPEPGLLSGILALVLYAFFIYCNFSGFIDIVLGVGSLLGFTLPENFNRPFATDNFLDFWTNRWHITLSAWIRTYVYNPLLIALLRRFPARALEPVWAVLAFFVTFFLVGVWHGQTKEFLVYGLLLGLGVSGNKMYQLVMTARMGRKQFSRLAANPLYSSIARGLTFTYFTLSLVFFWSNWRQMKQMGEALGPGGMLGVCAAIFAGSTVLLAVWEALRSRALSMKLDDVPVLLQCGRLACTAALLVIVLIVTLLMNQAAPDLVYKAF
jgi:alginate O-acetyltransferase complex protein AlgI